MKTRPWISISDLNNPAHADAEDAVQAASFVLFMLSGQKYQGLQSTVEEYFCEETGAPVGCRWDPGRRGWWNPVTSNWAYRIGPTERSNLLLPGRRIRLRNRPVVEITSITVGDTELDPDAYSLLDHSIVAREGSWSFCSGTTIEYTFGRQPPALGRMAARRLANELLLAASGDDSCALPSNVTSVSRQGLTIDIFDPQDFMDKGHTGLYEVDLFIAAVNPGRSKKRPKVFSPDMPRGYHRS